MHCLSMVARLDTRREGGLAAIDKGGRYRRCAVKSSPRPWSPALGCLALGPSALPRAIQGLGARAA